MRRRESGLGTYRPGLTYWAMGLLAGLWLFVSLADLLGWGVLPGKRDPATAYAGLILPTFFLVFLAAGWRVFHLDEEGLEVRGLGRGRFAPWAALSGVTTKEFVRRDVITGIRDLGPNTEPTAYTFYVRAADGRLFTTVGPWIGRRRKLVFEIRTRIRHAQVD